MFDRFTDRARKSLSYARAEAERLGHDYIGTEHMLLGLLKEGSGVAANVLENLDIDLAKLNQDFERTITRGNAPVTTAALPFTPRARKVLELTVDNARELNHNYVGTEHLLLGLLQEGEGLAGEALLKCGLTYGRTRQEIIYFLGSDAAEKSQPLQFRLSTLLAACIFFSIATGFPLALFQSMNGEVALVDVVREFWYWWPFCACATWLLYRWLEGRLPR